jgi:hypothetical protein
VISPNKFLKQTIKLKTKYFFIGFLIWIAVPEVRACDVCASGAGSYYLGVLPKFKSNFMGMRYQQRHFSTEHPPLFKGDESLYSSEVFHTAEIWGRYVPNPKWQIFGFLPVHSLNQREGENHYHTRGQGDATMIVNYLFFNTGDNDSNLLKHALQAGAGIKAPTGKSNQIPKEGIVNQNLQTGTGSWDIPVNLLYTIRYKKTGLNFENNFRLNTLNKSDYRFGNSLNSMLRMYVWKSSNLTTILPHAGLGFDYMQKDKDQGKEKAFTGGYSLFGQLGADVFYRNVAIQFFIQKPFHQELGDGFITAKPRFGIGLNYFFNQNKTYSNEIQNENES